MTEEQTEQTTTTEPEKTYSKEQYDGLKGNLVGQIGDLKREIVFNGDVLNTTSRIQELCNTYNQELLISRRLLAQLRLPLDYNQEHLANVKLKGKETEIHIYGITQNMKVR